MRSKKKKKKNNKSKIWLSILTLLVLIVGFYLYKTNLYENQFLPNTTINDINVSNLTVDEANQKITDIFDTQDFQILDNGLVWKEISKNDLGIKTDFKEDIENDLILQDPWSWPLSYFEKGTTYTLSNTTLNEEDLANYLTVLTPELEELNTKREKTVNATIEKNADGFVIVPEVLGTELNTAAVLEQLAVNIKEGKSSLELEEFVKKPTITQSSPEISTNFAQLNKITNANYTYIINGQNVTIPQDTVLSWVNFGDEGINVDQEAVRSYVETLGATYNTSSVNTSFSSTRRGVVSIPPGTYSWTIQTNAETEQLVNDVLAGNGMNRTPYTQGSATPDSPLIGSTYIEVDLQNQHMWYYKDGILQMETDIVSGKPSTPTPTGVFYVWNRERNATLVGENYQTPVSYWMPIDWDGVGIHDSNWQSAYGGELWQSVGSHGCINTPPGVMGQLFDNVNTGTPVLIF